MAVAPDHAIFATGASQITVKNTLSIIIPAYNEEKLLPATLKAVRESAAVFSEAGWDTEFIVCNNNSTDQTAAIAVAHGAMVVFESVNQIARARNSGAAAAHGSWMLFVDADSTPSRPLLAKVLNHIESGKVLAGGCLMEVDGPHSTINHLAKAWSLVSVTLKMMAGAFIFVEANAFREIGGFSTELYAGEELDLSKKLKQLARKRRLQIKIISYPKLITSGRKAHLYTPLEIAGFLARAIFRPRHVLKTRDQCAIWYDGRR